MQASTDFMRVWRRRPLGFIGYCFISAGYRELHLSRMQCSSDDVLLLWLLLGYALALDMTARELQAIAKVIYISC